MDKTLITLSKAESIVLRNRLENHLIALFSSKAIIRYISINDCKPELQILGNYENNPHAFPQIKLAFNIWSAMDIADRHNVLGKYQRLYTSFWLTSAEGQKTLTFCALFIHEFSSILAETMLWPN